MNALFAVFLIVIGIGILTNADEIAVSNALRSKKSRFTAWLIQLGFTHSADDERRVIWFSTWINRIGGTIAIALGLYIAARSLSSFQELALPPKNESVSLGWWLIAMALVGGAWGWRSRKLFERLTALIALVSGTVLIYHGYMGNP